MSSVVGLARYVTEQHNHVKSPMKSPVGFPLGLNAGSGMSLLLIAMQSSDAATAGNLPSMAPAVGHLVAAPFPWFIGWLSTTTGSWSIAYGFLVTPALLVALARTLAGQTGFVRSI